MKIQKEEEVVTLMINLYYKKNKDARGKTEERDDLLNYVRHRLSVCPFGDNKTFCSNCKIHCYKPEYREKIKKVMRYSGPRMLMYHPIIAIRHLVQTLKEKHKNGKEQNSKK